MPGRAGYPKGLTAGDKSKARPGRRQSYLEVYIAEGGKVKFTPLTCSNAPVVKAFFKKENDSLSLYCG